MTCTFFRMNCKQTTASQDELVRSENVGDVGPGIGVGRDWLDTCCHSKKVRMDTKPNG